MSTDTDRKDAPEIRTRITLTEEDEWWVATDEETGVTSQGGTRVEALENLDEAVELHKGDGREPTNEELREIGINPENNKSGDTLPDALK
ncbi:MULTISPECIES: type II toxin-antitoxin system HicB family antitoxin [Natrialbaceae]|uniref:type II toxin-antitoxin system HicB family antitoxin n=1 Tax=Natrialbaceae TaxID=1644061 RepID=UPI0013584FC9|nr:MULTISPECIES: type II toxin-antitoxin system HicB family antitoxin [Natrialbaceae]